ncbi:two-component system, CitB family, response regulator DctR [Dethiosulfatibacter aminovorans DSM 17477]|uniref:Transcriptional regulatory protein n=1 Tax=Dethiosulfatibacter aminovorans DSM 17477 TaxID=1121476 RepID=A0A1M6J835_9FIRM|nr:response regulator [Dethiosulfatibacter aminovorans]SHJ42832.1 two-component system, CitB family, response regulator DctR [Dethiosulfatibacter aminovorans DSM 17477]
MIKVLIVDDDPMVGDINKRYVESVAGYEVVDIVKNGLEALKILGRRDVELAIVDIYMPDMDGLTLIREIRKKQIKTDIILVTASNDREDIDTALKYGAVDYLIKPFKYDRLVDTLNRFKERRDSLNRGDSMRQEEIDKLIKKKESVKELPKGLQKKTLEKIWAYILENCQDKEFTAESISEEIDISSVTVRRYLEYMETIQRINSTIRYGTVGRPKSFYKIV